MTNKEDTPGGAVLRDGNEKGREAYPLDFEGVNVVIIQLPGLFDDCLDGLNVDNYKNTYLYFEPAMY